MNSLSKRTVTVLVTMAMTLVAVLLVAGPSGAAKRAPASTVTIWSDADRKAAVDRIASAWGTARGVNVVVVQKDFGKIRDDLKTVQAETAPDVIVGAHDWTGDLAASGLVLPLNPRRAVKAKFPPYALNAFSYGTAVKKLYGAPVVIENIGLVVNTRLAKVPTTFAQLQASALAFKKKKAGNIAIAVQQGAAGDAYHMYPFFSGPLRLRLRHEPGRQPRSVRHRAQQPRVPEERRSDRQLEQARARQREGRRRRRLERVPHGEGRLLGDRSRGTSTGSRRPGSGSGSRRCLRSTARPYRSSARRASW